MILDRKEAVAVRQDPFGKTWGIRIYNKELSYWVICMLNDKGELVVPSTYPRDYMEGFFTKQQIAINTIGQYLEEAWNYNDEQAPKEERKELKKKLKAEAQMEAAVG